MSIPPISSRSNFLSSLPETPDAPPSESCFVSQQARMAELPALKKEIERTVAGERGLASEDEVYANTVSARAIVALSPLLPGGKLDAQRMNNDPTYRSQLSAAINQQEQQAVGRVLEYLSGKKPDSLEVLRSWNELKKLRLEEAVQANRSRENTNALITGALTAGTMLLSGGLAVAGLRTLAATGGLRLAAGNVSQIVAKQAGTMS